jgi:predicted Zn-dependent protease
MNETTSVPELEERRASGVLAPIVVLCLFAALLPLAFARGASALSSVECLTMVDAGRVPGPESRATLEACSASHPEDVELLAAVGDAYASTERSRAEASYGRVIALDPDHADVRLKLGRLLLERGAFAEAGAQADAALLVQPNRADLIALRARARAGQAGR